MARPREFDMDTALHGATEIFWRQGFKATNLPDLLIAMGLTRGSFYKAFKDKESVYLDALDHYDAGMISGTVAALQGCEAGTAVECLLLLFQVDESKPQGCFLCNAIVELAHDNPQVADKTWAMVERLRGAIEGVLLRKGVCPDAESAAKMAELVLHLYFGFQALGKAGQGATDWAGHLSNLLSPRAILSFRAV